MKTVKIELFAGNTQIKQSFNVNSNLGDAKIIGSSINKIFEFNSRLKKYGAECIKANQDVSVVISVDEQSILDTYDLNSQYGFRLRFGNTGKSKRKFASVLNDLTIWAASETKIMTLDDLIKTLED
jgi:hypothetical protein